MNGWEKLQQVAGRIYKSNALPDKLQRDLVLALAGVECEKMTVGMVGNLVDDSAIAPMWRRDLTDEDKGALIQAVWEWYAAHTERALAKREGENGEMQAISGHLKFDGLMRLLDSLVDERIAGVWRELQGAE